MGWFCVRCSGPYRRAGGLWLLRAQAHAPPARNCQWIARDESIFRRHRDCRAWSPLSFSHRLCGCSCLPHGEPGFWFLGRTRRCFRNSLWCSRLFLHESHCFATLRRGQTSVFSSDDARRRGHTYLLCRSSHSSQRAPIFQMIELRCSTARRSLWTECSGRRLANACLAR